MMQFQEKKQITCILPKGKGYDVLQALKNEFGVTSVNVNNARGVGKITPLAYRGMGAQSEKEILTAIVSSTEADEIFEFIYHFADINRPHGGLMYMNRLSLASDYVLPDIAEEK